MKIKTRLIADRLKIIPKNGEELTVGKAVDMETTFGFRPVTEEERKILDQERQQFKKNRKKNSKKNPYDIRQNSIRDISLQKYDEDKESYESLDERILPTKKKPTESGLIVNEPAWLVQNAVNELKARLNGATYLSEHFGNYVEVYFKDILINVLNQRNVLWDHVAYIISTFDPRAVQIVNVVELPDGSYSVPEGQHTVIVLLILWQEGIIDGDYKVMCKVTPHDQLVPGSPLRGEAYGNWLFRSLNSKSRRQIDPYHMHKSRYLGARKYGSTLPEDLEALAIEDVVRKNHMLTIEKTTRAKMRPSQITYITGLYRIAQTGTPLFNESLKDLDFALRTHDKHFIMEKGVDGGWILGMGRYHQLAREQNIKITQAHEDALMDMITTNHGSPWEWHKKCKDVLREYQDRNYLYNGWNDSVLVPLLINEFKVWCEKQFGSEFHFPIVEDLNCNKFRDI